MLPVNNFYKHPMMGDGRLSFCKECTKARVRKHRAKNLEKARAYDHDRYHNNPERRAWMQMKSEEWRKRYPERKRAHGLVRKAVVAGQIKRGRCEVGRGCSGAVHAHHDDYSKPLDVRWLCASHHALHHSKLANN